jgi:hypothetical protein
MFRMQLYVFLSQYVSLIYERVRRLRNGDRKASFCVGVGSYVSGAGCDVCIVRNSKYSAINSNRRDINYMLFIS